LIKIVYEELVKFLGEEKSDIQVSKKKPFKVMMVGLFGSGKTTTIGKLTKYYSKRGYKVAALGLDIHRPAAMEQLEQIAKGANIHSFIDRKEKDPIKIYKKFESELNKFDIVIIDTAGRDALSKDLIEEIETLNRMIKPDENLLIISADIGQAAQKQAEQFHESCHITGVIVTKMDGTAKAGGALSACAITKAPINFIGVGEKIDDLEEFNPKGFVSRLLGMGDLEALLEKAKDAMTEEQAQDLSKKMLKGDYNFIDLYEQMQAMKKMGPLSKVVDLIPGMGNLNIPKDMLQVQDEKLGKWKHIFNSCTKEELENPDVITRSRIDRIAKGAGVSASDVRELLKMYKQSKKLMKMMSGKGAPKDIGKLMKKFRGKKLKY
jgi:signal recognition particle subunit SRP54